MRARVQYDDQPAPESTFLLDRSRFIVGASAAAPCISVQQVSASAAQRPDFSFHSSFWINLHHRLFRSAQLARNSVRRHPSLPEQNARLPAFERHIWGEAQAVYQRTYTDRDRDLLFDPELEAITTTLAGTPDDSLPRKLPREITAALLAAAPVYRAAFWSEDDAVNREWIQAQEALVKRFGDAFRRRLPVIYQTAWPFVKFRIDAARFAYRYGAYTQVERGFVHTVIESGDVRNADLAGTEIIFHEASHAIVFPDEGTIGGAIAAATRRRGCPAPDSLWHAVIFFTVGAVAEETFHAAGLDYRMYADVNGLFSRAWPHHREPLRHYWRPYVDGHGTLCGAIDHCVGAILTSS